MTVKIYLDDCRAGEKDSTVVRNPIDFEKIIKEHIRKGIAIQEISFDHDLEFFVCGVEITGYDCLSWMLKTRPHADKRVTFPFIKFHSSNPVGVQNMKNLLKSFLVAYAKQ